MTQSVLATTFLEEPRWFGPADRPLFGWLTTPTQGVVHGGVLLAPPIGREARAGRRALRYLATTLATHGVASLRFDYRGTGDSSGSFDEPARALAWTKSVVEAERFLRDLGLQSVSAVGLRLGATLVGVAAREHDLAFASMVLWDPCESGRTYLRELSALESLRREDFAPNPDGSIETSEFVFTLDTAEDLRSLSLLDSPGSRLAERVMVMSRSERPVSKKLRTSLQDEKVEWATTPQQASLLDVEPLSAQMPVQTIERIVDWLVETHATPTTLTVLAPVAAAVVARSPDGTEITERCVKIGTDQLFGIVCEPTSEVQGPLIVLINVANEDHTGPARLWVELSRRWASYGLRSVRFDLSGLGDSPWHPGQPDRTLYNEQWLSDVPEVVRSLCPSDPSNVVFIGLCSGAYLAAESALTLDAHAVCAINPPVGLDFLHLTARLERSRRAVVRSLASPLKELSIHLRWVAAATWQVCRLLLPSRYRRDVLSSLVDNGTRLFVLASEDDLSPYPRVPLLRSIDRRRIVSPRNYEVEMVPGLDHSMHTAVGRDRAVALLDAYVLEHFAPDVGEGDVTQRTKEAS